MADRPPLALPELIDAYRVVPRLLVAGYAVLVWKVTEWVMALPDVSSQQAAIVSVVYGAAAGVFGLYVNSGRRWT